MKKYGLLAGLAFALWRYIEFYSGITHTDFGPFSSFLPVPLYIVCIFMAIRERRQIMGGFMEFADGLKAGLGSAAIAGIIYSIAEYIYNKFIDKEWAIAQAKQFEAQLLSQGETAKQIQPQVQDFIASYAFRSSLMGLASMIFMGGIITIVLAATMRKKAPREI